MTDQKVKMTVRDSSLFSLQSCMADETQARTASIVFEKSGIMCTNVSAEDIFETDPSLQSSAGIPFFDLPDDVLLSIFAFIPIREIGRMAVACKQMNGILSDRNLWKALVVRDLSLDVPDSVMNVKA